DDWATVALRPDELGARFVDACRAREERRAVRAAYDAINRVHAPRSRSRAAAGAAMLDSEPRLALVLEHAHEAIVATDADGRILAWNAATEILFGCDGPDPRGERLADLLGGTGRESFETALAAALAGRTTREVVVSIPSEDDRELEI